MSAFEQTIIERSFDQHTQERHGGDFAPNFTEAELELDTNDFGMSPEEWEAYSKRVNESIAASKRLEKIMADRAEIERVLLLPPTAKELQTLLDHIAQRHGFADAQEIINAANQAIAA